MKKMILVIYVGIALCACEKEEDRFAIRVGDPIVADGATDVAWRPVLGFSYEGTLWNGDDLTKAIFYCDTENPPKRKIFETIWGSQDGMVPLERKLLPKQKYYWMCVLSSQISGKELSSEICSFTTIDVPVFEKQRWQVVRRWIDEYFYDYYYWDDDPNIKDVSMVDISYFFQEGDSATIGTRYGWTEKVAFSFTTTTISFGSRQYPVINFGHVTSFEQDVPLDLAVESYGGDILIYRQLTGSD
jgi:hypothetical protein